MKKHLYNAKSFAIKTDVHPKDELISVNMSISIKLLGLFCLCACISFASANSLQQNGRIVGGSSAVEKQFPYQVSLRKKFNDTHFCGGVIINENYVLSAAHCFLRLSYPSMFYGAVNITHVTDAGTRLVFKNLISHPHFKAYASTHDLALLRTKNPIEFSAFVNKVNLPTIFNQDQQLYCQAGVLLKLVFFYSNCAISAIKI